MGWEFNAEDPNAIPRKFWGLSRSSLVPSNVGEQFQRGHYSSESEAENEEERGDSSEVENEEEGSEGSEDDDDVGHTGD